MCSTSRKYSLDCKCLDFDASQHHHWISGPPEEDFYQDLDQGRDFPDWLKIEENYSAIYAALCMAKPQEYRDPYKKSFLYGEVDEGVDEVYWDSPDSVVPLEKLPFNSLLPLLNTYLFPASHTGMESIPFWIKIYARFWTSYGFYLVKVGQNEEFQRFRQKTLDPSNVWVLPYWCLREQEKGKWYRYMLLVVRDTVKLKSDWSDLKPGSFGFLKAIASVSLPYNNELRRIRHIAIPMIPHAFEWMCILMPDCYNRFIRHYSNDYYIIRNDDMCICQLKIGYEGEEFDTSHPVLMKDILKRLTSKGGSFVFFPRESCLFIIKNFAYRGNISH